MKLKKKQANKQTREQKANKQPIIELIFGWRHSTHLPHKEFNNTPNKTHTTAKKQTTTELEYLRRKTHKKLKFTLT